MAVGPEGLRGVGCPLEGRGPPSSCRNVYWALRKCRSRAGIQSRGRLRDRHLASVTPTEQTGRGAVGAGHSARPGTGARESARPPRTETGTPRSRPLPAPAPGGPHTWGVLALFFRNRLSALPVTRALCLLSTEAFGIRLACTAGTDAASEMGSTLGGEGRGPGSAMPAPHRLPKRSAPQDLGAAGGHPPWAPPSAAGSRPASL